MAAGKEARLPHTPTWAKVLSSPKRCLYNKDHLIGVQTVEFKDSDAPVVGYGVGHTHLHVVRALFLPGSQIFTVFSMSVLTTGQHQQDLPLSIFILCITSSY